MLKTMSLYNKYNIEILSFHNYFYFKTLINERNEQKYLSCNQDQQKQNDNKKGRIRKKNGDVI